MPISDERWITEIDITFAMPRPPTASASKPANNAVCCRVLSAWALAFNASLGTSIDTSSVPPSEIAVGMSVAVCGVVPSSLRM